MEPEKLKRFNTLIDAHIAEIHEFLEKDDPDTKPVESDTEIGRISRIESIQNQQLALELKRRLKTELKSLEDAKERIEKGHYGICPLCQKEISEERLGAMPEALFCIECAH